MALRLSELDSEFIARHCGKGVGFIYCIALKDAVWQAQLAELDDIDDQGAYPKVYIGQSIEVKNRVYQHLYKLRKGTHDNPHLQRVFDIHGEEALEVYVIESSPESELNRAEETWIWRFNAHGIHGYNIAVHADNPTRGRHHTDSTKEKIASIHRGKKLTAEHRAACVAHLPGNKFRLGIPHSPESRARMSAASKGKPKSAETRAKMSAAANRPERLAHVSEQSKNMPPETRAKILAKLHAPENIAKRVATRRANREAAGLIKTPEEKRAAHAAWARAYRAGPKGEKIRAKRRANRIRKKFATNNVACE